MKGFRDAAFFFFLHYPYSVLMVPSLSYWNPTQAYGRNVDQDLSKREDDIQAYGRNVDNNLSK